MKSQTFTSLRSFVNRPKFFDPTSQTFLLHFTTHHTFLRLLQPSPTRGQTASTTPFGRSTFSAAPPHVQAKHAVTLVRHTRPQHPIHPRCFLLHLAVTILTSVVFPSQQHRPAWRPQPATLELPPPTLIRHRAPVEQEMHQVRKVDFSWWLAQFICVLNTIQFASHNEPLPVNGAPAP